MSLGTLQGSCLLYGGSASILGPFCVITLHSDYNLWRKNGEFHIGISVLLPEVTFAHYLIGQSKSYYLTNFKAQGKYPLSRSFDEEEKNQY